MSALVTVKLHVSFIQFQNSGEIYVNTPSIPERKKKKKNNAENQQFARNCNWILITAEQTVLLHGTNFLLKFVLFMTVF